MPEIISPESAGHDESWLERVRQNLDAWSADLETLDPRDEPGHEPPDLYSFYGEMCALRHEVGKGLRRQHESSSRINAALDRFEPYVATVENAVSGAACAKSALSLVELAVRLERFSSVLGAPVRKRFFGERARWTEWASSLKNAFSIVFDHYRSLLAASGIDRIETRGKPFDPQTMIAIAVDTSGRHAGDTVVEEFAPGYIYAGKTIKLSEVRVAKLPKGN